MSNQFVFTHERLSKLPIPEAGRVEYFDGKQQKLRLRVSATGAKSFAVVKKINNKPKRVTIGQFPEISIAKAREEAIKILDEIRQGIDPVAEKRKKALESIKLVDVLESYLSDRDLKPYTIRDYRYKLKLGFVDWLQTPIADITEEMVLKRHKKISQTGKTTANTTMRVLRLTMNYAVAVGIIPSNPTDILSKARLWHKNNRKDRLIPSNKLQLWHQGVQGLTNQKAKVYLLMALYMGFRSSEMLTLEWSQVDMNKTSITLYDTKNGTNHMLPIPKVLLPYIKALKELTGSERWVFAGRETGKPMAIPTKPIKAVVKVSGVDFSPHDCRRTFATIAEAVNIPLTMIRRLMNHVTTNDVTGGYIVTEEDTLRKAIDGVADYIQARVSLDSNLVTLYASKS